MNAQGLQTYYLVIILSVLGAANAQSQDLRNALPKILRSMNRADLADPFFTLRNFVAKSEQTNPSSKEHEAKIKELQDLEPWKRARLRTLIDQDLDGILKQSLDSVLNEPKSQFLSDRDLEGYILRHLIAPITPVYGVSPTCYYQSMDYATHLFINATPWAYQMLDSTGKTPDGVLTDTLDFCDVLDRWTPHPTLCEFLPFLRGLLVLPKGNTVAIGHYEGCVAAKTNEGPFQDEPDDFVGNYCFAQLVAFESPTHKMQKPLGYSEMFHPQARVPGILDWISELLPDNMTSRDLANAYLDSIVVQYGQCIPSGCSADDFNINALVIQNGLQASALAFCGTQEFDDQVTSLKDTGYGMLILFGIIGALIVVSTIVDMVVISYEKESDAMKANFAWRLLKSFSAVSNGRKLLNTNKTSPLNLYCLNGIRVISMIWIILGHTYIIFASVPSVRPLVVENIRTGEGEDTSFGYELVLNAFPAVDTFFFMSGLLVAYLSFFELEKGRFNLILFYVHRYIRLTIPMALTIAFIVGFANTFGHGPLWWSGGDYDIQSCRENWWLNLLYMNNFFRQTRVCLGQTWYLSCDFQMFILSPLFFWPMFKWKDNVTRVVQYWMVHMVIFTAIPVGLMVAYDLPPSHALISAYDYLRFDMNAEFYSRFYTRVQPYLIGIMLGFILYKTHGKEVKISWYMNVVAWVSSIVLLLCVVFGLGNIRRDTTYFSRSYTMFEATVYQGFSRIAWGVALAWIVFACVKGYGGAINSFLSWSFFSPLAKLCFMVYFIHLDITKYFALSFTFTVDMMPILMTYFVIALSMVCFGVAFVGTLVVEAPFINLEKLLIGKLLHKK